MTNSTRPPKSPWQKYGKTRYAYSETYRHWREIAVTKGACHPDAIALACSHAKKFGVTVKGCGNG